MPSIASSLPNKGDPGGYRKWLGERGVVYGLEYTNDVLSNVRGGTRTGTIDQGKLHGILTVDFGKLAGWDGLSLFGNFFQIHNTGRIRRDYVGGVNTIAAIEAVPTTRLSELWLEQKFAGRRGEPAGRPARGGRRVFLQRTQHAVPAKRLADHRGVESAERRRGLSAVHARASGSWSGRRQPLAAARGAQRRPGRPGGSAIRSCAIATASISVSAIRLS